MDLGDLPAQRQAEARAARRSGARFIHHIKRIGDTRQLLRRNAAPRIDHAEQIARRNDPATQLQNRAWRGGLVRVIKQIEQQRPQQLRFAPDGRLLHIAL